MFSFPNNQPVCTNTLEQKASIECLVFEKKDNCVKTKAYTYHLSPDFGLAKGHNPSVRKHCVQSYL